MAGYTGVQEKKKNMDIELKYIIVDMSIKRGQTKQTDKLKH